MLCSSENVKECVKSGELYWKNGSAIQKSYAMSILPPVEIGCNLPTMHSALRTIKLAFKIILTDINR